MFKERVPPSPERGAVLKHVKQVHVSAQTWMLRTLISVAPALQRADVFCHLLTLRGFFLIGTFVGGFCALGILPDTPSLSWADSSWFSLHRSPAAAFCCLLLCFNVACARTCSSFKFGFNGLCKEIEREGCVHFLRKGSKHHGKSNVDGKTIIICDL